MMIVRISRTIEESRAWTSSVVMGSTEPGSFDFVASW